MIFVIKRESTQHNRGGFLEFIIDAKSKISAKILAAEEEEGL